MHSTHAVQKSKDVQDDCHAHLLAFSVNPMERPSQNSIISILHVDIYICYIVFTCSINALEDSALSLCLPSDNPTRNVDSGKMSWLMGLLRVFPA